MPLKHLTETLLVALLACVTLVTGVMVSTLPALPEGFFPWLGVFIATVIYPALLYPLLRRNRADYAFRALHFAPLTIALLWLLVEVIVLKVPKVSVLHSIYTWGWTALPVLAVFVLIAAFCVHVIRRWIPRLTILAALLIPFVLAAGAIEQYTSINPQLAASLWGGSRSSSSSLIAVVTSSKGDKNLSHSSSAEEEAWRKKMRDVEKGKDHEVTVTGPLKGVRSASALSAPQTGTGKRVVAHHKKLPQAGGEMESIALFLTAAFAATVQMRAKKRLA